MIEISPSPSLRIKVHAPVSPELYKDILTTDALRFIGYLCVRFEDQRQGLLDQRKNRAAQFDSGELPQFLCEKPWEKYEDDWKCASIPSEVLDRRVEITGPVSDRKMVINGFNSGANVYMADFEDSTSPTWDNMTEGQRHLKDACHDRLTFTDPQTGKYYSVNKTNQSVLFVRPRGWHLDEAHITVNGRAASASLVDFGLFLYHNAHQLVRNGKKPYFYLPKLENHLEARLWNDVFEASQQYLSLPRGTIRATVLLETITAAFEMEEILYELRHHSLGLNCGRWDYLFSVVKKFKYHKLIPDRSFLTMTDTPLLTAYVQRLIYICHKRDTFAMGGMSAAIPIRDDPIANEAAMNRVRQDKIREVTMGHDGSWVAHPALVKVARDIFDQYLVVTEGDESQGFCRQPVPNQIHIRAALDGASISESDLLKLPSDIPPNKTATSDHLRRGVSIVLAYVEAWLRGVGCIPLCHQMEDAATAEISRAQLWQWRHHAVITQDDGLTVTAERLSTLIHEEVQKHLRPLQQEQADSRIPLSSLNGAKEQNSDNTEKKQQLKMKTATNKWVLAGKLVEEMLNKEKMDDFLTTVCYPYICVNVANKFDDNNNEN